MFTFDRERQSMSGGGAEREGDTESEAGSRLWAVSTEPDVGLELTNLEIMTWAEVGRSTELAIQAPQEWELSKHLEEFKNDLFSHIWGAHDFILFNVSDDHDDDDDNRGW